MIFVIWPKYGPQWYSSEKKETIFSVFPFWVSQSVCGLPRISTWSQKYFWISFHTPTSSDQTKKAGTFYKYSWFGQMCCHSANGKIIWGQRVFWVQLVYCKMFREGSLTYGLDRSALPPFSDNFHLRLCFMAEELLCTLTLFTVCWLVVGICCLGNSVLVFALFGYL